MFQNVVSPSLFHDKSLGSCLSLLINIFPIHLALETHKKLHLLNYKKKKKDELSRKLNVGQEHLSVEMISTNLSRLLTNQGRIMRADIAFNYLKDFYL